MKIRTIQWMAAGLATVGMMMPTAALAEVPAQAPVVLDVALRDGGVLVGQMVDRHGATLAAQPVALVYDGEVIVRAQTDERGVFAVQGLRGGEYHVATAAGVVPARLWAANTAPPTARSAALIVSDDAVVNGQSSGGIISWVSAHPFAATAGVAALVAIPVAVADDDNS